MTSAEEETALWVARCACGRECVPGGSKLVVEDWAEDHAGRCRDAGSDGEFVQVVRADEQSG